MLQTRSMKLIAVAACVVALACCDSNIKEVDSRWVALKTTPVTEWSVDVVAFWMNYTIGYPEYAPFIEKHRVDGPTLLYMSADDFDTYFPIENAIHLVKLRAHIDKLQGKCLCRSKDDESLNFWNILRSDNRRLWVLGLTSLQFPRLSMLYARFFDEALYVQIMSSPSAFTDGDEEGVHWIASAGFWVSTFIFPDAFMLYQCLRLLSSNYIVMPFFMFHFALQQYNEYYLLYSLYDGSAFEAGMSLRQKIWQLYSWFLLLPPLALATSYFMPLLLQQTLVFVFMGHVTLVVVGLVMYVTGAVRPEAAHTDKTE